MSKPLHQDIKNEIYRHIDKLVWTTNDCLEHPSQSRGSIGYPRVNIKGKFYLVYKLLFEFQCGEVPEGKQLHHMCHNPRCCNMVHLQVVTPAEHLELHPNIPSTINKHKTHCIHGHPLTEENTYNSADGGRHCKTCGTEKARRRRVEGVVTEVNIYINKSRAARAERRKHLKDNNIRAKQLSAEEVATIKQMYKDGMPGYKIADYFGKNPTTIYDILKGKTWVNSQKEG